MKFDLRTHLVNAKGKLVTHQPYRLVIEEGVRLFERPVKSGYFYYENGALAREPKAKEVKMDAAEAKKLVEAKAKLDAVEVKGEKIEAKPEVKVEAKVEAKPEAKVEEKK